MMFACGTLVANPQVSAEERAALAAKQREAEYQAYLQHCATHVIASLRSPAVAKVQHLMRDDPVLNVHTMNLIGEIIEDGMRGDLGALRAVNDFKRFNRSINHPDSLGSDARHAVTNDEPHPRAMDLAEAREFIRELTNGVVRASRQVACSSSRTTDDAHTKSAQRSPANITAA